jgi:hypothetical protein
MKENAATPAIIIAMARSRRSRTCQPLRFACGCRPVPPIAR